MDMLILPPTHAGIKGYACNNNLQNDAIPPQSDPCGNPQARCWEGSFRENGRFHPFRPGNSGPWRPS